MRRPTLVALASLLAVLLLAVPAAAVAEAAVDILAVDDDAGTLGPDPAPRNAEGNAATELAGFEDRDVPFTWGAAWILTAAGVLGLGAAYLFYRFRVKPYAS